MILITAITGTLLCILGLRYLPNVISLEFSSQDRKISSSAEIEAGPLTYNDDISLIPKKDFYLVHSLGNDIYVSTTEGIVYKVKAKLSEFPKNDVTAIENEIVADSLTQLREILNYLES